ncbi:hypothetical protein KP615_02420 [Treponema denticola]|uniref:hypothetical protein n=1 Tax=Treponema denticola TaxID=158 RepID=UPI003CFE9B9A
MKTTVCYIDDKIPVANFPDYFVETKLIDQQVLRFLLKNDTTDWSEDENVKGVIVSLVDHSADWECYAFTAPQFFINHRENGNYINPDIILYDWDYNDSISSDSSEVHLFELLKSTHSIIIIYTGADKNDELTGILQKEELKPYKDRLTLIEKGKPLNDENNAEKSVDKVIKEAKSRFEFNFSYKYAKELLYNANRSLNEVLSEISSLSVQEFINSFGYKEDNNFIVESEEFAGIIFDKYKQKLIENLPPLKNPSTEKKDVSEDIIKKIWSYRLYYSSKNNQIKQGDIIKYQDDLFLVFSSDCHMERFWCKNYGFLAVIPLYKIGKNEKCKDLFGELTKSNNFKPTSLTNTQGLENIAVLPAIPINDNFFDYILFPKGIKTIEIPLPTVNGKNTNDIRKDKSLEYSDVDNLDKVVSISENFKNQLIQFVQDNLTGYGCPDFPETLWKYLQSKFKKAIKDEEAKK